MNFVTMNEYYLIGNVDFEYQDNFRYIGSELDLISRLPYIAGNTLVELLAYDVCEV